MSNPSFADGRIKIGKSDRDPTTRKEELETTGVPEPFVVEYYAFVEDHHRLERELHRYFSSFRPNKNREFFTCSIPEVINIARDKSVILHEKVNYKSPEEIEKIRLEKEAKIQRAREVELEQKKREEAQLQAEKDLLAREKNKHEREAYSKRKEQSLLSYIKEKNYECAKSCPKKLHGILWMLLILYFIPLSAIAGFVVMGLSTVIFNVESISIRIFLLFSAILSFFIWMIHHIYKNDVEGQRCSEICRQKYAKVSDLLKHEVLKFNNGIENCTDWKKFSENYEQIIEPKLRRKVDFIYQDFSSNNQLRSDSPLETQVTSQVPKSSEAEYKINSIFYLISKLDRSKYISIDPTNSEDRRSKIYSEDIRTKLVQISCIKCSSKFKAILHENQNKANCPVCSTNNQVSVQW